MAAIVDRALHALQWVFLLRVPLLSGIVAFVVFPCLALSKARSLLGNLLDITPFGMFVATLSALLCAWSSLITGWIITTNGQARLRFDFGMSWGRTGNWFVAAGLCTLPLLLAAIYYGHRWAQRSFVSLIAGVAIGAAVAAAISLQALRFYDVCLAPRPVAAWRWFAGLSPQVTAGYLENGFVLPSHLLGAVLFGVFVGIYLVLGVAKAIRGSQSTGVPTLAYVLLLITMVCWVFSGLTFFLDRFGIPVLFVLLVVLAVGLFAPWTDHLFQTQPVGKERAPFPEDVLLAGGSDRVVLVAASGGGIQAAAWTARVLTGLELKFRGATPQKAFAKAVRMISSVSGGSVGAMYFSSLYQPGGTLPANDQVEEAWHYAAGSSLENIGWGLVYGDLLRLLSGVSWWTDGRGRSLEKSFLRTAELSKLLRQKLSDWFAGAAAGDRPANIFNSTLVETGDRLLFSTSHFHANDPGGNPYGRPSPLPRWEFHPFQPGFDVSVSTAARLSASFPYVSPASRPDIGGPFRRQLHVVDGGYFDNDGMVSLVEWLDQGLRMLAAKNQLEKVRRVMILTAHGLPDPAPQGPPPGQKLVGWPFQLYAPLQAVLAVRSAAQRANDELQIRLLQEKWAGRVDIVPVPVDFNADPDESPPLSWHLTPLQKAAVQSEWDRMADSVFNQVNAFL